MKTIAWDIWLYCNYNCKFCNTKTKNMPTKIYDAEEIFTVWKNIYYKYGKCKICVTGGEPLLYPNINLVLEKLSAIHYIHITTNLSMNIDFLSNKKINRDNIFFNVTFHPFYENVSLFVLKLLKLREYKYKLSVCYMNDRFQLLEFLNYKKFFLKNRFDISLVSSINSDKNYNILNKFIDNISISLYNKEVNNDLKKKICNAGTNYVCIDELGNAYSCSIMKYKLGNIFDNSFRFINKNIECNKECIIFENQY